MGVLMTEALKHCLIPSPLTRVLLHYHSGVGGGGEETISFVGPKSLFLLFFYLFFFFFLFLSGNTCGWRCRGLHGDGRYHYQVPLRPAAR